MKLPVELLNQFIAFNFNAGYSVKGTEKGIHLSKKNQKSLFISHSGVMNKEAEERYHLMLKIWFRDGRKFMDDLNAEIKRITKSVY